MGQIYRWLVTQIYLTEQRLLNQGPWVQTYPKCHNYNMASDLDIWPAGILNNRYVVCLRGGDNERPTPGVYVDISWTYQRGWLYDQHGGDESRGWDVHSATYRAMPSLPRAGAVRLDWMLPRSRCLLDFIAIKKEKQMLSIIESDTFEPYTV